MELGNSQLPIISSTITSFRKKKEKRKEDKFRPKFSQVTLD